MTAPLPTDPNVPEWSGDPAHYAVQHVRARSGHLLGVSIVSAAQPTLLFAAYADDEGSLDRILTKAADWERTNPYDNQMPSDRAIILAALDDCGITPTEEG